MNDKFVKKALVSVPHRSGFDKSFRNLLTGKCGTLVPIFCDEVMPNTSVNINLAMAVQLPPLASDTFMNVNYKVEAFFVPTRLLMAGYEDWISRKDVVGSGNSARMLRAPIIQFTPNQAAPGSLLDYLGVMTQTVGATENGNPTGMTTESVCTAFPALAYGLIWDSWYRNPMVQQSLYYNQLEAKVQNINGYVPSVMKWFAPEEDSNNYILGANQYYRDQSNIFTLRQRNFGSDYFTMATPSPQSGDAQKVSMVLPNRAVFSSISSSGASITDGNLAGGYGVLQNFGESTSQPLSTSFTIASLRAANSMQIFLERQNLCGPRYVDFVKANYGANLKDSIAQRPVYLGSFSQPVYSKGIYQSNQENSNDVASNNPFNSVGARYGHAYAEGSSHIVNFTAEETGYIMILGSLVPDVTYSSGIERYLSRYIFKSSQSDLANPILQNVGNQPILAKELDAKLVFDTVAYSNANGVFGYVERYADWKTRNNQLHGLMRDGGSLAAFALQRYYDLGASDDIFITSEFLQIPVNFMDQVTAANEAISEYGYWADFYFDYKVSQPLYEYSLPSLQDPAYEHGNSFLIDRSGKHID